MRSLEKNEINAITGGHLFGDVVEDAKTFMGVAAVGLFIAHIANNPFSAGFEATLKTAATWGAVVGAATFAANAADNMLWNNKPLF